ncbi:MAG: hypothetical protein KAJ37_02410 [Candidatus Krumholzibacteria bacterium]|nr:hypothetical protein [Candidatus Krumholzibacteria bacterium]
MRASSGSTGGLVYTYDELGNLTARLGADASGTGGMFYVQRDPSDWGFFVEGNWAGSEEPGMGVTGSARSAFFRMDQTDNASVVLPNNALSAPELLDEPGVASDTWPTNVSLDGTLETLLSRSITAPVSGYVFVIGTCEGQINHAAGTQSRAQFGVSDVSTSFPGNQDVEYRLSSTVPSGEYDIPLTVHGLFSVTAGTHTFYLLAQEFTGAYTIADMQFSLMFIPTAYGSVTGTLALGYGGSDEDGVMKPSMTPADIAAERAQSIAANQTRLERELADMRAEFEAFKEELRREREGS